MAGRVIHDMATRIGQGQSDDGHGQRQNKMTILLGPNPDTGR